LKRGVGEVTVDGVPFLGPIADPLAGGLAIAGRSGR